MSDVLAFAKGALDGPWPSYAVIGDPIDHSLSPRLHTAALATRQTEERYGAIHVPAAELSTFLTTAGAAGMRGLNVTVPHKVNVLDGCERRSEEVDTIGATNTLVRRGEAWIAHNTDARGLALAISRSLGRQLPKYLATGVVLGAGGAARAAVAALHALGTRNVTVLARRPDTAAWATSFGATVKPFDDSAPGQARLLIQATPVGLHAGDPCPIDETLVPREALVMDLTYGAVPTRLLQVAAANDCIVEDGRPMLVAQAALAFALWFGAEAPLAAMAAAVDLTWEPASN